MIDKRAEKFFYGSLSSQQRCRIRKEISDLKGALAINKEIDRQARRYGVKSRHIIRSVYAGVDA